MNEKVLTVDHVIYMYDITCLQKSPNGQTASGTKCTLVCEKKPQNLIIWRYQQAKFKFDLFFNKAHYISNLIHLKIKQILDEYIEKYKMYKLCIQIHTLLPAGKSPWYSKVTQSINKSHGLYTNTFGKGHIFVQPCCLLQ